MRIPFSKGIVRRAQRSQAQVHALPPEVLGILEDGGLIPHVKKVLAASS